MADPLTIKERYDHIQTRVERAARRAGRNPGDITVVVVSKWQPVDVIRAACQCGITHFGENYPEETQTKLEALQDCKMTWHMIGHLQSRKAGIVARHFDRMHSLDSVRLAEKLDRSLAETGKILPVMLEVNFGGEESKSGWAGWDEGQWGALMEEFQVITTFPRLKITGLMCMPPLSDEAEDSRKYFRQARNLQSVLSRRFPAQDWSQLSMGTSSDFEVAVEEGATFVRIGTAILGPRPPKAITSN